MMTIAPPIAAATMVGTTLASEVVQGKYQTEHAFRIIVGGFLVGAALYGIAGMNTQLGAAFAWFVIVVSMLTNGLPVLARVGAI